MNARTDVRSVLGTARSRAADVVNLFATPLQASHYVELVNPLWSTHKLQARVEKPSGTRRADSRTITLRPGRNWRAHRAGQHVRVGVPIEGRQLHAYLLDLVVARARDGCITITVKAPRGGRMSRHWCATSR